MPRVLIVEDDPKRLDFVRVSLQRSNAILERELAGRGLAYPSVDPSDILTARDLETALAHLREEPFVDLVILDLQIPRSPGASLPDPEILYGFEVLEYVRSELQSAIPVVILSVNVDPESWERSHGLRQHKQVLDERRIYPADDLLLKEPGRGGGGGYGVDSDLLQRKLVSFLIDLSEEDERLLNANEIIVPRPGTKMRNVLRQLKRYACSALPDQPRADVLLLGENGVGKTTYALAYHLLRSRQTGRRLGFEHLDLGSLDFAGSAPNIALFGASNFDGAWSLGAFARNTFYRRGGNDQLYPGQVIEAAGEEIVIPGVLSRTLYPTSEDVPDFDRSGTLFLDEVVNVGENIQALLLQALSYNTKDRHVYTTGHAPRRLRVGPTVISATAQKIATEGDPANAPLGAKVWRGLSDYRFRIDQRRVVIPPLRERRDEILPLLRRLVRLRTGQPNIVIEPDVAEMLNERLELYNNVADLQRIADQVEPQEPSVSWRHVRPLFLRESPVLAGYVVADSAWDRTACARYLEEVERTGDVIALSRIAKEKKTTGLSAYRVGLMFLDRCGCTMTQRWPHDDETIKFFGHDTGRLRTYMSRLNPDQSKAHGLREALQALQEFKR